MDRKNLLVILLVLTITLYVVESSVVINLGHSMRQNIVGQNSRCVRVCTKMLLDCLKNHLKLSYNDKNRSLFRCYRTRIYCLRTCDAIFKN